MIVTLDTPRLHLRQHDASDEANVHNLTADEGMRRYLSHQASVEDSYRRFLATVGGWALYGFGTFAVIERETGDYVGNCGLFRMKRDLKPDFDGEPEAGWIIAASRWGKGYASEAMAASIAWFEGAFGPQPTVCMIVPGNKSSERIAAKLGYRPIGLSEHRGDQIMRYRREAGGAERLAPEASA
jgi:RimJ/RimL family protein N-acetyltransferase